MSNGAENINEFEDCVAIAEWDVLPRAAYMSPRGVAPYSAETTVTLPVFSDMLYFLTRGPFTKGAIRFSSGGTSDSVNIKTTFYYYSANMIEYAKVCILQRDEVNNGIGILVRLVLCSRIEPFSDDLVDFDADRYFSGSYCMFLYTCRVSRDRVRLTCADRRTPSYRPDVYRHSRRFHGFCQLPFGHTTNSLLSSQCEGMYPTSLYLRAIGPNVLEVLGSRDG